jgi:hypothetical protein
MTTSFLTAPSFTEVVQRLTIIPTITHAFFSRSRAARVLASGAVLVLLYKLIRTTRRKPKHYVNLTSVGETGGVKGQAQYDIIVVGGGMSPFPKCGRVSEYQ